MPIRAVVYVSEASDTLRGDLLGLRSGKLQELVDDATRFNRDAGVSGVLLFDGTRFLQYLEGPPDGVDVALSRALGASSHHDVIELQRGSVTDRRLPYWPMRWLPVEVKELTEVAVSDWGGFKVRGDGEALNATAIDRLIFLVSRRALVGRQEKEFQLPPD
ncbi:BLUF domain-containing protein [Stenotrophomonas sp. SMYL86]|uniref:BLUF domain-containing protein n=1 Tax=Stenotrophomonas sp. SMYL86 TaxID=3076044 RepID=UPI002E780352|nr:BLUF domain-containing protein [Stenotrophomonas sp. SMYL86]